MIDQWFVEILWKGKYPIKRIVNLHLKIDNLAY